MATSGSINFNMTARDLCTWALRKVSAVGAVQTPSAEDLRDAALDLNMMLKGWQATGPNLFRQTFGSVTLVASTGSYALSPKPSRVVEMRYRNASGADLPMNEMTRQEYVDTPLKSATGTPTSYYVDYQRTEVRVYVWPVPSSVTTETLQHTYSRAFDDIDSYDDDLDIPQEWFETVGYNLADRLTERFQSDVASKITARARQLHTIAMDHDRESFVQFEPADY